MLIRYISNGEHLKMLSYSAINLVIIILLSFGLIILLYVKLAQNKPNYKPNKNERLDIEKYTIANMTEHIRHKLNEIVSSNLYDLGLTEEEFKRRCSQRTELKKALKGCTTGDYNDKTYVKQFIFDLLIRTYNLNDQTINYAVPFEDRGKLTTQDKFEILLYVYKKKVGFDALNDIIQAYQLDQPKMIIENAESESFIITENEIHDIYKLENPRITFEDKLHIIVQRIYAYYKGFGVIDDIRDMNIDGVSGGVSGIGGDNALANRSVWLFYKGISIHCSFLSFGSELELKRICQNIYKYNNPGQLSEANGYKVNEMKDGSRVVVVRPPFSESWAFFVRKFDLPNVSLERLIQDENAELPIAMIRYLMKGARITAVTGAQGSGKTTLLMAMIKSIYGSLTLRIQEMAFELHARNIYPERNILTFRETSAVSGQEGLDVQKKTDGAVNILGEIATDAVAAWMIQMSQVASLFTVFTHHAKTFKDLVYSLRNSLLKVGIFNNEMIAEEQVVQVINFDIHLTKDYNGRRYIERITECVPLEHFDSDTPHAGHIFKANNIIEFKDGKYVVGSRISENNIQEMLRFMSTKDRDAFNSFLIEQWGVTE